MVNELPWVKNVNVTMSAQPAKPLYAGQLPAGLQTISNIVAVSSCKVDFPILFGAFLAGILHLRYMLIFMFTMVGFDCCF